MYHMIAGQPARTLFFAAAALLAALWAGMAQTLRKQDILTAPLDVTQVYSMQFLQEIYGS